MALHESSEAEAHSPLAASSWLPRALIGGTLMGLANLVPGISGGTMLLASGIYTRFIDAIADVTRLRFRRDSLLLLVAVITAAAVAVVAFSTPIKYAVVHYRWAMYALFLGMTFGGVPVIWPLARPFSPALGAGAVVGAAVIASMVLLPQGSEEASGFAIMFLAGIAGASAMILPGISGSTLLVVMGAYVPLLSGITAVVAALKAGDISGAMDPALSVILPVGAGVLVGIPLTSHLFKWAIHNFSRVTFGALLGFLVGTVVPLWPFQKGVAPRVGELFKGQVVTAESLLEIAPEKYPTAYFTPGLVEVAGALVLLMVGFALTMLVARVGRERGPEP